MLTQDDTKLQHAMQTIPTITEALSSPVKCYLCTVKSHTQAPENGARYRRQKFDTRFMPIVSGTKKLVLIYSVKSNNGR